MMPWFTLIWASLAALFILMLAFPAFPALLLIFLVPVTSHFLYIENRDYSQLIVGASNIQILPVYSPVILIAALAVFITNRARRHRPTLQERHLFLPLGLLLLVGFLVLFDVYDLAHSTLEYVVLVTHCLLFYVILGTVNSSSRLKTALWCMVVSGLLQSIAGIAFFSYGYGVINTGIDLPFGFSVKMFHQLGPLTPDGLFKRVAGTQASHLTAMMLAATFPMATGLFVVARGWPTRLFLLAAGGIILVVLVMTLSRGGLVGIMAAATVTFLVLEKLRPRWILLWAGLLVTLVVLTFITTLVANSLLKTEVEPRLIARTADAGTSLTEQAPDRIDLWQDSFRDWQKKSYQGLGVGNTKLLQQAPHAHSIYFSFLFDFGVAGCIVLVWFGLTLAGRYLSLPWHQSTDSQVLLVAAHGGLAAVLVHGLIDFEYNTALVWVFLGLALAAGNLRAAEIRNLPVPKVVSAKTASWSRPEDAP